MKRKITITYRWWRENTAIKKPIDKDHIDALKETAWDHIISMMAEGYTSGELHDNIFMQDTDIENGEEGITYKGWWETTDKPY